MTNSPNRPRRLLPALIAGLAVVAVVLVVAGRLTDAGQYRGWQDPVYSVLLAFTLDGTFLGQQNVLTLVGAFAAALVFYLALLGSLWVVFRSRLVAWRAARIRHHAVVVGDGADALELARALGRETNVVLVGAQRIEERRILSVARPAEPSAIYPAAHARAARAVVVMTGDDRLNAAIATSLAGARGDTGGPPIWCEGGDRLIADRVASLRSGPQRLQLFDDAQTTARDLFARHPAHAIAERMAAARAHLLVVGFGRLGQAIAEEGVFSAIADGLGAPMVTVLDHHAPRVEAAYREDRPALGLAADFAFIEAELSATGNGPALSGASLAALARRDELARVTTIALCLPNDADNLRLALSLPEIRRREGRYFAPAFMRLRDGNSAGLVLGAGAPNVLDPNAGVSVLPRPARVLASDILDRANRDGAARLLHEAYWWRAARSSGAATDWNHLPETYRRANRRSADHIPAKLFALGLASEHDADSPITIERHAHAARLAPALAAGSGDMLERLAELEHRRWVADRVVDGWSYGAQRDDDRKHHPLLEAQDFAGLSEEEKHKDRDQVRTVLGSVVVSEGQGVMPEIRVALAGHRNLEAHEEARAAAEAAARLAARLALRDRVVTLVSPLAPGADLALAEAVSAALAGKVGELRLIVPEAVPYRVVLEVAAREAAGGDREALVEGLLARRAKLFERFGRVDIVRIGVAGRSDDSYRRDEKQFEAGLQRANAYLAQRCDLAAVLWDGADARGAGGTGELVVYWRDPAAIPAALDPGTSPRRAFMPRSEDSLVVVPVARRREPARKE